VLGPEDSPRQGWEFVIDLETNPGEDLERVVPLEASDGLEAFRRAMHALVTGWHAPPDDQPRAVLSDEERERLAELGYF